MFTGPSSALDLIDSKGPKTASSVAKGAGASRARLCGEGDKPSSTASKTDEKKPKRTRDLRRSTTLRSSKHKNS